MLRHCQWIIKSSPSSRAGLSLWTTGWLDVPFKPSFYGLKQPLVMVICQDSSNRAHSLPVQSQTGPGSRVQLRSGARVRTSWRGWGPWSEVGHPSQTLTFLVDAAPHPGPKSLSDSRLGDLPSCPARRC